jgi:hypothetical protein
MLGRAYRASGQDKLDFSIKVWTLDSLNENLAGKHHVRIIAPVVLAVLRSRAAFGQKRIQQ